LQAIDLILEQWMESKSKPSNLALACFEYISSRDASKAVSIIDEHQMNSIAARLLSSIKLHSDNLAEALDAVSLIENINFLVLNATYFFISFSPGHVFKITKILLSRLSVLHLEQNRLQAYCKVRFEVDCR
jgi:hypothetical protein